jgi:recombination protein RecR
MRFSPALDALMEALRCLPGVGPKSAQRMAMHLLERDRDGAAALAGALQDAVERVGRCERCRSLAEAARCDICSDPRATRGCCASSKRRRTSSPSSRLGAYRGRYFVLLGHLSPIDGIGPEDIGLPALEALVREESPEEVILATNPNVEGEATAYYITRMLEPLVQRLTRIAHGVPLGGELEYVDGSTLAHAFSGRTPVRAP